MQKRILTTIGIILAVGIVSFAYYAISPYFIHIQLDEAAPDMKLVDSQAMEKVNIETAPAFIRGTTGHPASGTVRIIDVDGKKYIRYENFKTINGPDIYVYLAKDLDAKEFIDLGEVRATEGNINYRVPDGVTVENYRYVMVWCKAFGVLFNYADLQATP